MDAKYSARRNTQITETHEQQQHVNIVFENVAVAKSFVDMDFENVGVA